MAAARRSSPANSRGILGIRSSATQHSPTPSSIALSTMPIGWNWTGRPCASSKPPSRPKLMLDHPRRKPPGPYLRQPNQQKGIRNDRRAQLPARPGGSTGTTRARRCASREGAPRHARVPPIDYRDGLSPCLTNSQETDITTVIQRRRQHPRRTAWSRSFGTGGRDPSEWVVAIVGMPNLLAGPAAELLPHMFGDEQLPRHHVQRLGDILADLRKLCAATARAAGRSRMNDAAARQVIGKVAAR